MVLKTTLIHATGVVLVNIYVRVSNPIRLYPAITVQ